MQLLQKLSYAISLVCLLHAPYALASGSEDVSQGQVPATLSGHASETNNPKAYKSTILGWEHYRLGTPNDLAKAVTYFEQAIELDPDYARAHSALAAAHWAVAWNGWSRSLDLLSSQSREQARLALKKAKEHPSALTHQIASEAAAYFYRRPNKALAEAEAAINFDANDPAGHLAMATALIKAGRPTEAEESVRTAMRLDPHPPASYFTKLGEAQYSNKHYQLAAATLVIATDRNPNNDWSFVYLAAAYGQLGNVEEAAQAVKEANTLRAKRGWGPLKLDTVGFNSEGSRRRYYFKWFGDYKHILEGLRKAGVTREIVWSNLISMETSPIEVKGAKTIDVNAAKRLHELGVPFIDTHSNWHQSRIPGAYFLEKWTYNFNEPRFAEIAGKTQQVVIYASSTRFRWAAKCSAQAATWGYEKIFYFQDGLDQWKAAGYPVDMNKK